MSQMSRPSPDVLAAAAADANWQFAPQDHALRLARKPKLILYGIALFGLAGQVAPQTVVMTVGGYGDILPVTWLIGVALGLYVANWFSILETVSQKPLAGLAVKAMVWACVTWATISGFSTTVPKVATHFATQPDQIEVRIQSVRGDRCRSLCRTRAILSGTGRMYLFELRGQPALTTVEWPTADGFTVDTTSIRYLGRQDALISGEKNWFGLRVTALDTLLDET